MKTVSTFDFRNKLSDYLEEIYKSDTPLIVSRFGKPVVKIVPYREKKEEDFMKYFVFMKGKETGVEFEDRVRRNKKERDLVRKVRRGNA